MPFGIRDGFIHFKFQFLFLKICGIHNDVINSMQVRKNFVLRTIRNFSAESGQKRPDKLSFCENGVYFIEQKLKR